MTNYLLNSTASPANTWWIYIILIGLVLIMLIVPSITNRKRVKEYNQMIDSVRVGDTIRTVGGVIGRITKINDKDGFKTIILETGSKNAKTTMEFDMASVATVLKGSSKPAEKQTSEPAVEEIKEQPKLEEAEENKTNNLEEEQNIQPKQSVKDTKKTSKTDKSKYRVR